MADTDMSSSSVRDVTGVALPVDASLNDSIGLDSVHSHVTADFGSASVRASGGPSVPQVRMTPDAPRSSSGKFLADDDMPDDLGIDEDLETQSIVNDPMTFGTAVG